MGGAGRGQRRATHMPRTGFVGTPARRLASAAPDGRSAGCCEAGRFDGWKACAGSELAAGEWPMLLPVFAFGALMEAEGFEMRDIGVGYFLPHAAAMVRRREIAARKGESEAVGAEMRAAAVMPGGAGGWRRLIAENFRDLHADWTAGPYSANKIARLCGARCRERTDGVVCGLGAVVNLDGAADAPSAVRGRFEFDVEDGHLPASGEGSIAGMTQTKIASCGLCWSKFAIWSGAAPFARWRS